MKHTSLIYVIEAKAGNGTHWPLLDHMYLERDGAFYHLRDLKEQGSKGLRVAIYERREKVVSNDEIALVRCAKQ